MKAKKELEPVIQQVLTEQNQGHETRKRIFIELENELKRPVASFFTSVKLTLL